ncbi:WecB/TagA/CpsF family glycosyltransferase [Methylicorpusculum oleiharenae]|uniref:WecB/TagA/CpsF family glycosyltransferase n=1 Tax=Methylicorpusculum oleiharenae TaxID=1338687 RepID=UPI00135A75F8|nr:WecB/TagA/CpsF family glycosyltransferase [Methylicorpusculum oleiharenae]MCD2448876.1 WecB/TagA/CpsF family glycosyltransferase [Methylicorpusculum oleiharenae]
MNRNVMGLDIAKQVFHLFSMKDGKAVKRKLKRSELLAFIAQLPVSLIAMEACGGAHHWAREFTALGHEVVLLNARFVNPVRRIRHQTIRHGFEECWRFAIAKTPYRLSIFTSGCVVWLNFLAFSPFQSIVRTGRADLIEMINNLQPHFLWVGIGAPKQEKWIAAHLARVNVPAQVDVGAAYDFHTGHVNRAPVWMQKTGLK